MSSSELPGSTSPVQRSAAPANPDAWLRDGWPDWEAISFEVTCSRCGYNLRGLVQPRCPECGLEFVWLHVLDRSMVRTVWLFEQNWSRQPVRSWWKTLRRSVRPWRFWRDVSIHETVHAGPLWFLMLTSPAIPIVLVTAGVFVMCVLAEIPAWLFRMGWFPGGWRVFAGNLDARVWGEISHGSRVSVLVAMALLAGFPLVLLVLTSLRQTLARCRVRRVQMLRAIAYSCMAACTVCAFVQLAVHAIEAVVGGLDALFAQCAATNPAFPHHAWSRKVHETADPVMAITMAAGLLGTPVLYITVALKRYLRLPHAFVATIAGVIIACLCITQVLVLCDLAVD